MIDRFKFKWFFQNIIIRKKFYHLFCSNKSLDNTTIFFLKKEEIYPGVADIIKAIVGSFYIAKLNKKNFYIVFNEPFALSDYLVPNKVNWLIDKKQIDYSIFRTSLINYRGVGNDIKYSSCKKQYHIYNYLGINILQRNNIENWQEKWRILFNELFKPSDLIIDALNVVPYKEDNYIAIHLRFINALEILEPSCLSWSKPLEYDKRIILINKILNIIEKIHCDNSNILIFSDSNEFLNIIKEKGYKSLPGKVGHIGYSNSEDTILKTFVDWFAMSKASTIYRIKGDNLYSSAFPLYASLIGNKPYIEIEL